MADEISGTSVTLVSAHTVRNLLQLITDFVGRAVVQSEAGPEAQRHNIAAAARRVGAAASAWDPFSWTADGHVRVEPLVHRVASEVFADFPGLVRDVRTESALVCPLSPAVRLAIVVSELVANAAEHGASDSGSPVVVRVEGQSGGGLRVSVTNRPARQFGPAHVPSAGPLDDGGLGIVAMIADSWRGEVTTVTTSDETAVTVALPGCPV